MTFQILSAVRRELRWTHYKALMRVENVKARDWYMNEAAEQNWSRQYPDFLIRGKPLPIPNVKSIIMILNVLTNHEYTC